MDERCVFVFVVGCVYSCVMFVFVNLLEMVLFEEKEKIDCFVIFF